MLLDQADADHIYAHNRQAVDANPSNLGVYIGEQEENGQPHQQVCQAGRQGVVHGYLAQDASLLGDQVENGEHEHVEHTAAKHTPGGKIGYVNCQGIDR